MTAVPEVKRDQESTYSNQGVEIYCFIAMNIYLRLRVNTQWREEMCEPRNLHSPSHDVNESFPLKFVWKFA
jgi:hypothetical protein